MKQSRLWATTAIVIVLGFGVVAGTDLFRSISANLRTYNNVVKHLLSEYVDDIGFLDLPAAYVEEVTCQPSTYLSVTTRRRQRIIHLYGDGVPVKLWALAELIDSVRRHMRWRRP